MNKKCLFFILLCIPSLLFARVSTSELQCKLQDLCCCVSTLCNTVDTLGDRVAILEIEVAILNEVTGEIIRVCPETGTYTISEPGLYKLSRDITCCIVIDANNVELDLNSHTITGLTCDSVIQITDTRQNIEIKNGNLIGNGTNSGITTGTNSANIVIHDVNLSLFGPNGTPDRAGIFFTTGTNNSRIYDCLVRTSSRCIELQDSNNNIIENCIARDFTAYGIFIGGDNNLVNSCTVGPCNPERPLVAGIWVDAGDKNTIFNCYVKEIADLQAWFMGIAAINATNTTIDQCVVHDLSTTVAGVQVYGITIAGEGGRATHNHVFNLTANIANSVAAGIHAKFHSDTNVISHNTVHDIYGGNSTAGENAGIDCRGASNKTIVGNRVFNVVSTGDLGNTGGINWNANTLYGNSSFAITPARQYIPGPTRGGAQENWD